jgi:putative ABC transport system permease protein
VGIVSSFGGVALMVALFVVASTFALLVQQRSREVALLRAVAATPRQVRRMICRDAQVVALGYVAISVANSLIVGTSARARELARLRLIGTTQRQVIRMMRWEALIVVATAIVVGGVIAGTTLTMLAYGLTGDPVPYVPPLPGAALLAAVVALGMTAIALPTRYALRSNPTETISIRE